MPTTAPLSITLQDWMPTDTTWAGVLVLLVLGLLLAAAVVVPLAKLLDAPAPPSRARRGNHPDGPRP